MSIYKRSLCGLLVLPNDNIFEHARDAAAYRFGNDIRLSRATDCAEAKRELRTDRHDFVVMAYNIAASDGTRDGGQELVTYLTKYRALTPFSIWTNYPTGYVVRSLEEAGIKTPVQIHDGGKPLVHVIGNMARLISTAAAMPVRRSPVRRRHLRLVQETGTTP